MTCEMMRERLLEAELDELAGQGNSPVAAHVRECARCRAVAEQLLGDTRQLAEATSAASLRSTTTNARARGRMSSRRYLVVGTLAAAALALVIVRRGTQVGIEPVTRPASPPASVAAATSGNRANRATHPAAHIATAPSVVPPRRVATSRTQLPPGHVPAPALGAQASQTAPSSLAHPLLPRQFPAAKAVAPTPLAPRSASRELVVADARPPVSVAPAHGKRAAVMRTRDPNVTVVWFY